jgi:FkbM family methyltransferase
MIKTLKLLTIKILTSDSVGRIIRRIYHNRIPNNSRIIYTYSPFITNRVVSLLYFNAYETAELRFIKKYLRTDLPVVELGASIGVVSMQIAAKTKENVYCIEANPNLIDTIRKNFNQNHLTNFSVFNYIIANSAEPYYFIPWGDNTTGQISNVNHPESTPVPSVSLTDFLHEKNIGEFILVSDIEGAEIQLLKDDSASFKECRQIIIELHDKEFKNERFTVNNMVDLFIKLGFRVVDRFGPNIVFEK